MNHSAPPASRRPDRALLTVFGWYVAANAVLFLVGLSAGLAKISFFVLLGTALPLAALLVLTVFQISSRPRCSLAVFVLVFAGVLAVAWVFLRMAHAISAAV